MQQKPRRPVDSRYLRWRRIRSFIRTVRLLCGIFILFCISVPIVILLTKGSNQFTKSAPAFFTWFIIFVGGFFFSWAGVSFSQSKINSLLEELRRSRPTSKVSRGLLWLLFGLGATLAGVAIHAVNLFYIHDTSWIYWSLADILIFMLTLWTLYEFSKN